MTPNRPAGNLRDPSRAPGAEGPTGPANIKEDIAPFMPREALPRPPSGGPLRLSSGTL